MSDTIIRVEKICKRYLVGHRALRREQGATFRDMIVREGRNFTRKTLDLVRGRQIVQGDEIEEFWALKDVSFDIKQGEVLGIIGRNGAGKSTLLKILSRITEPTEGRVTLHGRVASLLEVGTGFHQELTGRENIYLNGAILGMTQREIKRKFDEIIAFADVEQFLDTPVKRYSSGMYMRLAFAVAAHLEPEILIVDEVLAVGDSEFQKKCLGKMDKVAKDGRTVLFVSHNLTAISRLCRHAIWLIEGKLASMGAAAHIVSDYLSESTIISRGVWEASSSTSSSWLHSVRLTDVNGVELKSVSSAEPFLIEVSYDIVTPITGCSVALRLKTIEGECILITHEGDSTEWETTWRPRGRYRSQCFFPGDLLKPGVYSVNVGLFIRDVALDRREDAISFEIGPSPRTPIGVREGAILPILKWNVLGPLSEN